MMRPTVAVSFAVMVLAAPAASHAQSQALQVARITAAWSRTEATISGRVTGADGAPLGGAEVSIRERGSLRVITPPGGEFRFVIPADTLRPIPLTFVATAPGYTPVAALLFAGAGPQEIQFALPIDRLGRDRPVQALGSGGVPARLLPFAAGMVTGRDLEEAPALTAAGGLAGRIAGARMIAPSGNPGSEPILRLRGTTVLDGSPAPLVVIDGTIAGTNLADFSPEDIERIEIAKGPAAGAIFGSNAGNGVLQIVTLRGRDLAEGKIAFSARNELGRSTTRALANSSAAHPFQLVPGQGGLSDFRRDEQGNRLLEPDGIADNLYPAAFDHPSGLFGSGTYLSNHLAIAGRRGSRNFRLSFQNTRSEGVVFGLTGFKRQNYRFNLDQRLGPRAELEFSGAYTTSSDRDALQDVGGPFFAWRFLEPSVDLLADNPDGTPYRAAIPDRLGNASNPLYRLANQVRTTDRSRMIDGGLVRWRPTDWLTAEGGYHFDRERREFADLVPAGFLSADGIPGPGLYQTDRSEVQRFNLGGSFTATGRWNLVTSTTRAGFIYEDEYRERHTRAASSPDAFATEFSSLARFSEFHVTSLFAESSLELAGRLTLNALTRREVISMLPPAVRTPWYYRVAGGIRLFGETTIRVAYGTTGLRSALDFALTGDATPDGVRAPYAAELEVGSHLGTPDGRFTFDYSFSRKRTRNQVGIASVASPVGFVEAPANIGTVESRTHELALSLVLVAGRAVQWSLWLSGDRSRGEITEYLLPDRLASSGFQPAAFLQARGAGLGVLYGNRAVRTVAELYDDPVKAGQSGPGEAFDPADFLVNEEGYVVRRALWRTAGERPISYVACKTATAGACPLTTDLVQIGDGTPDFVAVFGTRLVWGGFGVSGLVAWSQGGDIYNGTRQWPFFESRDPQFDQRDKPELEQKPTAYYRAFFNGLNPHAHFVESGTFIKVRELSLSYTLKSPQLRKVGLGGMERLKVGLVGRNLFTVTNYTGQDPEVATLSGDPFQRRIDWFGYPHFRTISGVVEISF